MALAISIDRLQAGKETEWDEFVLESGTGTPFHLTAWKNTVQRTFGMEPLYLEARVSGTLEGVLPLFRARLLPMGNCLVSTPFAVYGGILARSPEVMRELQRSAVHLLGERRGKYIEFRNITACDETLPVKDLYATFRRQILPTEEENMAVIPRKERAEIRRGKKNGLVSEVGGVEFLDDFYGIYAHSVHNLGTPVFPKSLFRNLLEEFREGCRILAVRHQGKMVSGVISLFYKDQVLPYYGGSLKECLSLSVNDVMYWDLLCYGLDKGYRVFDFGRSKKGTGAYRFKEHWGFEPTPLNYQYYLPNGVSMPNYSPSNPKFSLAIETWKKLPFPLTKILGPPVSRYFF